MSCPGFLIYIFHKIVVTTVGGSAITKWAHFSLKIIPRKQDILQMVKLLLSSSVDYRFLIEKTIC